MKFDLCSMEAMLQEETSDDDDVAGKAQLERRLELYKGLPSDLSSDSVFPSAVQDLSHHGKKRSIANLMKHESKRKSTSKVLGAFAKHKRACISRMTPNKRTKPQRPVKNGTEFDPSRPSTSNFPDPKPLFADNKYEDLHSSSSSSTSSSDDDFQISASRKRLPPIPKLIIRSGSLKVGLGSGKPRSYICHSAAKEGIHQVHLDTSSDDDDWEPSKLSSRARALNFTTSESDCSQSRPAAPSGGTKDERVKKRSSKHMRKEMKRKYRLGSPSDDSSSPPPLEKGPVVRPLVNNPFAVHFNFPRRTSPPPRQREEKMSISVTINSSPQEPRGGGAQASGSSGKGATSHVLDSSCSSSEDEIKVVYTSPCTPLPMRNSLLDGRGNFSRCAGPSSPDPVALVQQIEEDERMARQLQHEFDRERDPDFRSPIEDPPDPPPAENLQNFFQGIRHPNGYHHHHAHNLIPPMPTRSRMPPRSCPPIEFPSLHYRQFGVPRLSTNVVHSSFMPIHAFNATIPMQIPDLLYTSDSSFETLLSLADLNGDVPRGIRDDQINRLPVRKYKVQTGSGEILPHKRAELNKECQVCLADYTPGDVLRILPCFHEFHLPCIDPWLKINRTCPVCRITVRIGNIRMDAMGF